jgi:cell wall-associated NlpC family hydrolase
MSDPRRPARPDLAAAHLKGQVEAARFVEGVPMRIRAPVAPLRREPRSDAPLDTEALFGEAVTVYENDAEGWSWVQLKDDSYVGYMPTEALGPDSDAPTHRIDALRTFVYPGPSIKEPPLAALSFGSTISVMAEDGKFFKTEAGFIFAMHAKPLDAVEEDYAETAKRFDGIPYLWGGKSSLGIDCSGLVQTVLKAAGLACPRDTLMQVNELGLPIAFDDRLIGLKRGDFVFWKGHVGIMLDAETLVHANGHFMEVVSEPLRMARDRTIAKGSGPIVAIRRL